MNRVIPIVVAVILSLGFGWYVGTSQYVCEEPAMGTQWDGVNQTWE